MAKRPVVLVTGAARRLGRAIAIELGGRGFDVAVHCHRSQAEALATADELQAAGAASATFRADLSIEADCRALVPAVVARFGRLDAVVNSASVFEHDDAQTFGMASMERHWRANTAPAVLLATALHEHLVARGSSTGSSESDNEQRDGATATGCVVNLLDQKLWNPNPDHFSYTLSKAALQAATVMLAQALAPQVRVCGVAPGVTLPSGPMSDAEFDAAHRLTPLGRSSTPDDIARAVHFLIAAQAVTGTTLLVDGGQHLGRQPRDVFFLAQPDASA